MKEGLVVTNYNNFKDLSYFIGQHKQALRMMEEVNNFYLSFLKSKLIHSYEISRWPGNLISCKAVDEVEIYLSKYTGDRKLVKRINEIIKEKAEELEFDKIEHVSEENEACKKILKAIEDEFIGKELQFTLPEYDGFPTLSRAKGTVKKVIGKYDNVIDTYHVELSSLRLLMKLDKPVKSYDTNFRTSVRWECEWNSRDFYDTIRSFETSKNKDRKYRIEQTYKKICDISGGQQLFKDRLEKSFRDNQLDFWFVEKDHKVFPFSAEEDLKSFKFEIAKNPLIKIQKGFKDTNEYLVVSTTSQSSGNTTDRWKTFYEEKEHLKALLFDVSTGNLSEAIDTSYVTCKRELDVHNGWHPYDDD